MKPCLKQLTRCVIVRDDGRRFEATNECDVDGLEVCPRVTANCSTLAAESSDAPGTAYLYGHTWLCGPCQWVLTAINVRTFHVVPDPKDGEWHAIGEFAVLR